MRKAQKDYTLSYQLKKHKWAVASYLVLYVLHAVFNIVATFFVAYFLSALSDGNFDSAIWLLILSSSSTIISMLCYIILSRIFISLTATISLSMRTKIVERCFTLTSKAFSEKSSGVFQTRINSDPQNILGSLDSILDQVTLFLRCLITLIYIIFVNWIIGLMVVLMLVALTVMETIRVKIRLKNQRIVKKATEKSSSLTAEIIQSEKDIKTVGLEPKLFELANKNYSEETKAEKHRNLVDMFFWSSRSILVPALSLAFLLIGLFLVKDTAITLASFLFIFTNNESFGTVIWCFGNVNDQLISVKLSTSRIYEIFDDKKFESETFGKTEIENIKGKIEFKNVYYSYTESDVDEDDDSVRLANIKAEKLRKKTGEKKPLEVKSKLPVFENLSFEIPENKTVAFVGKSGSGKTTILSLICKLYEVDSGKALIDGVNVNELSKKSLRHNISLVNQFPVIFNASIKQNLLLANADATESEIIEASRQACLHEFVISLKNGYETKVGEGGIKLSGGQRQRLAIARALLRKSKIILFDESTSSLDNATQEEIKKSIDNLGGSHTVVIVAHRLSTIRDADTIFFLEKGKISDSGTFDELVEKCEEFKNFFKQEVSE